MFSSPFIEEKNTERLFMEVQWQSEDLRWGHLASQPLLSPPHFRGSSVVWYVQTRFPARDLASHPTRWTRRARWDVPPGGSLQIGGPFFLAPVGQEGFRVWCGNEGARPWYQNWHNDFCFRLLFLLPWALFFLYDQILICPPLTCQVSLFIEQTQAIDKKTKGAIKAGI